MNTTKMFISRAGGILRVCHRHYVIGAGSKTALCGPVRPTHHNILTRNWRCLSTRVAYGIQVTNDGKEVDVFWDNENKSRFHASWLRHNCKCDQCYNKDSGQSTIYVHELPMEIHLEDVKITDDGHLSVRFKEEDHTGTFPPDFLQEHSYSNGHLALKKQATKINPEHVGVVPEVQWSDVRDSEESLYQCLKNINEHGLCMVRNGSIDGKLVEKCALKIGPIWDNTYGAVWDVKSQKTPTNFGYTNKEMQYHMDLPFYQAMPGIEFLHCLRFDATVEGGQTLFLDITDIAENFRKDHPEEFNILATIPFTFARVHNDRDYPINMVIRRPIIQLNREHEVVAVFWNPTVTGALQAEENEVESFYKAYQLFAKQLYSCQDKEMVVRLQPGEIVIWNNRRLVHRRNAFHGDGDRHFRGVYIDICEYKSRLSILSQKYGDGSSIKRVGNGDWF